MGQDLGSVGAGRYRLLERLGGGHTSETFLAAHAQHGTVVVKRFSTRNADSWKRVELAEREALVLQRLNHELLPRHVEHFEENGELFTVMTRVEGEDLGAARRRGRSFSEQEIVALLRDAAAALGYLHGQRPPLVHRDLKPSNIVLGPDGRFRIVDLGAAGEQRAEAGSTVVGTFGYMAPEQFQGRASPVSDIYSLGATALALLTRTEPEKLPHVGLRIDVRRALGQSVSEPLVRTLELMLEPDPDRRPADLGRLLARPTPSPPRSSPATRAPAAAAPAAPAHTAPAHAANLSPATRSDWPAPLRAFQSWPMWKKISLGVALMMLLGRLTRGELHGPPGFWLLALGFMIWSARKARSTERRLRVANGPHRVAAGHRVGGHSEATSESEQRRPEPQGRERQRQQRR
jgi:serine/threonine protein kinase